MATIREMVRSIQKEVRDTPDLLPDRACVLLNQLTALICNIGDELIVADLEYKRVLLECLRENKAANRARIEAETTPQFVRRQEAIHLEKFAVEMIRSLKITIKSKEEEMRLAR